MNHPVESSSAGEWRDVQSSLPWVASFNKCIREESLPRLNGREIIIASDASGQHRQNPFEVLGILILDFDASLQFEVQRQVIRKGILKDSRRLSFKKLDEPVRKRALVPFLLAADTIPGLCLCVAVNKRLTMLGGGPGFFEALRQNSILKASWTFESFERMSRTAHFISLLIAGLCCEGQNVFWISDEDEMFESPVKSEDTLRVLSTYFQMYVKWAMGNLRVGTTKLDEGDRFEEDFAAIADIAAGALGELVMRVQKEAGEGITEAIAAGLATDVTGKSDLLLSWLADNSHALKRASLVFDRRKDGKFCITRIGSKRDIEPLDTTR